MACMCESKILYKKKILARVIFDKISVIKNVMAD